MVDYLDTLGTDAYTTLETPYGIGAAGISAALPALVDPYASTGRNFGVTLGAGLLAGLLGGMGRSSAQSQNQALMFQGEQMSTLPMLEQRAMVREEPRLAGIYSALRAAEAKREEKLFDLKQAKTVELGYAPSIEVAKKRALLPLEQASQVQTGLITQGLNQGIVPNPHHNPNDPTSKPWLEVTDPKVGLLNPADFALQQETDKVKATQKALAEAEVERMGYDPKKEDELKVLRTEFASKPEVKTFPLIEKEAQLLFQAVKDKVPMADLEIVRRAILVIEPAMAVREGEQAAVSNSQTLPDWLKGEANAALGTGARLSDSARDAILRIAERSYNTTKMQYDRTMDFYKKEASAKGIDPERINYIGDAKSLKELYGQTAGFEKSGQPQGQIVSDASGNQWQYNPATNSLKKVVK